MITSETKFLINNNRARVIVTELQVNQQIRVRKKLKKTFTATFQPQRISMSFILNSKRNDPIISPKKKSPNLTVNQTFTKLSRNPIHNTESNKINTNRVNKTKINQIGRKRNLKTSGIRILIKSKNKNIKPIKKHKKKENDKAQVNLQTATGKTSEENVIQ
jgi:hypothetical protein